MDKSILSKLILEHLYNKREYTVQYFYGMGVHEDIINLAKEKGIAIDSRRDERVFREAFWELASKNLVVQGSNANNSSLPFVSITKYGIECYEEGKILPYDPEGFLNLLYKAVPNIDEIIKMYFDEAVNCFSNMNYLPSTVMIGVGLERTILYLLDEFNSKLNTNQTDFKTDVLDKKFIKTKFDCFLKFLKDKGFEATLSQVSKERLNSLLPSIINLIRITRNETGHPTGREVDRDEAQANILLAKEAVIFCYKLLDEITF